MTRTATRTSPAFRRGFTLIEVLLALTLFALTATTLYVVFFNGLRMDRQARQQGEISQEVLSVMDQLGRDLENAVPYDGSLGDQPGFTGTGSVLAFIVPSGEGMRVVRYSLQSPQSERVHQVIVGETTRRNAAIIADLREEDTVREYLVREATVLADVYHGGEPPAPKAGILSTHVAKGTLRFQFLDQLPDGDLSADAWEEKWDKPHLPAGVRVEAAFLPGGGALPVKVRKDILLPSGAWGPKVN